jgi:hypothetical protein
VQLRPSELSVLPLKKTLPSTRVPQHTHSHLLFASGDLPPPAFSCRNNTPLGSFCTL